MDWSITPAEKHDDAAADDVELGPLLLDNLVQFPHLFHLAPNLQGSILTCSYKKRVLSKRICEVFPSHKSLNGARMCVLLKV
jgi:hypothetical protein